MSNTSTTNTVTTTCSGCSRTVALDLVAGEARVRFGGNGLRGQKHVPGGTGIADLLQDDDGLLVWDCPVCEYADSYEAD